ncbi:hypothetical protein BD410DRAFT_140014 [Rickenella mellea]|uniref:Uncharacterized protein n=1 Tax=Rickenella mellea TaxID=50990 RepID=A0A4Y7PIJ2_9AGAM|nr:hypothetical protein BD410DRAFT_140014 [Rickenella mellea]
MFATSSWPTRRALLTGQSSGRNKRIESLSFHQTYRYGSSSLGTNYKDDIGNAVVETSPEPSPSSSTNEYESRILSYFRGVHANLVSSLSGPSAAAHHPSESGRAVRTSRSLIEAEEDIPRTKLSRNVKLGNADDLQAMCPRVTTRRSSRR